MVVPLALRRAYQLCCLHTSCCLVDYDGQYALPEPATSHTRVLAHANSCVPTLDIMVVAAAGAPSAPS